MPHGQDPDGSVMEYVPYTSEQASAMITDGAITNNLVFNRGYAPMLSNEATEDGVMCSLAKYVPAVSSPAGGTPLFSSDENAGNLNDARYRSGWVNDGSRGTSWKHSDMKDVSYFYVWPLYSEIVNEKGTLK